MRLIIDIEPRYYKNMLKTLRDIHSKVYRNEHCDRAGKCYDYIGYHCAGCNSAKE